MPGTSILVGSGWEEMIEALLPSESVIVGLAREDLHQTSPGNLAFPKRRGARFRMRGFTLFNKNPVHKVIWLRRELLIWIGIRVVSPFPTRGLHRID